MKIKNNLCKEMLMVRSFKCRSHPLPSKPPVHRNSRFSYRLNPTHHPAHNSVYKIPFPVLGHQKGLSSSKKDSTLKS